MFKKRNLIKQVIKEYWEESCPICSNANRPVILFGEGTNKTQVELSCPTCGFTVSYNNYNFHNSKKIIKEPNRKIEQFICA